MPSCSRLSPAFLKPRALCQPWSLPPAQPCADGSVTLLCTATSAHAAERDSAFGGFACQIIADLDEVAIRIANVDAADRTGSAGPRDWSLLDRHAAGGQLSAH